MKYFLIFLGLLLFLLFIQFIVYRSFPFIGAFPKISAQIILKSNHKVILKINQKGSYSISGITILEEQKVIYAEHGEGAEKASIKRLDGWSDEPIRYKERNIELLLSDNSYKMLLEKKHVVFKFRCQASYDQYFAANSALFTIDCPIFVEK